MRPNVQVDLLPEFPHNPEHAPRLKRAVAVLTTLAPRLE
jgi:hypothetical protein